MTDMEMLERARAAALARDYLYDDPDCYRQGVEAVIALLREIKDAAPEAAWAAGRAG